MTIGQGITIDTIDARVRRREADLHPSDGVIVCAVIQARKESGAGIYNENACPYILGRSESQVCSQMGPSVCIEPESYRKCANYIVRITDEDLKLFE